MSILASVAPEVPAILIEVFVGRSRCSAGVQQVLEGSRDDVAQDEDEDNIHKRYGQHRRTVAGAPTSALSISSPQGPLLDFITQ